ARADTAALGRGHLLLATLARLQAWGRELLRLGLAALPHELAGRRHATRDGSSVPSAAPRVRGGSRQWPSSDSTSWSWAQGHAGEVCAGRAAEGGLRVAI